MLKMFVNHWNRETVLSRIDASLASDSRWVVFLFILAFLLKLIYIVQSADSLQLKVPILDAKYYDDMAQGIANGHFIRVEAFFMGPLYSYLLAFVYSSFGRNLMLQGIIQITGGSITVVLTYLLGRKLFRPSVALIASGLLLFYGAATFYEGQFLMMWLGTLLNMLMLYVLHHDFRKSMPWQFILAGFLIGLSALARANILIFVPVVAVWILFVSDRNRRFLSAAIFIITTIITISPATIHNYLVSRDFVPITSNGGMNFYIGNNEEATGAFYPPKGVDFISDTTTRRYVERMLGRDMKPSEISSYWLNKSIKFMRENPVGELKLLFRKTALYLNGFELPQIESFDLSKKKYGIFKLLFVNFWIICSLGLIGILYTIRQWKRYFLLHWFIIFYSLSIIIFFITARYRIQIVPALSLFAAYAAVEVLPAALANPRSRFVLPLLLGLLLYLTRPGLFAFDRDHMLWREHIHEGRRWNEIGETSRALQEISQAVELQPDDPESYIHRAIIYKDAGKLFQAIEDYNRALEMHPGMPAVHYDLAQVLRRARMYPSAIEEYLKAIALDSLMIEAYNNLGLTYRAVKDYGRAMRYFTKVIKMDPHYIKAYNNLGASLAESGDLDGAVKNFNEAIQRDPSYAPSYKNLAMAYVEKNELYKARRSMQRYMELNPEDGEAAEILRKIMIAIKAREPGAETEKR